MTTQKQPKEWTAGALLGTSGGYWSACALHTAVVLDLFTVIAHDKISGDEIADKLGLDRRAASMLFNALAAMSLLEKQDGLYSNTSFGKKHLVKDAPEYLGFMIKHHHYLLKSWSQLEESIRSGEPVRARASQNTPEQREAFLMGMHNNALGTAPIVAKALDLSGRRHLIDVGGGPGTYSIHFCKQYPQLKATVCDLPSTRIFAEKNIAAFGMSDRIDFVETDYLSQAIGGNHDAAWLSHILHGEGPRDCRSIIAKVVGSLNRGGLIAIHDFILNETMDTPLFPALFSLNMLLGTPEGQSYSEGQLNAMLRDNGVRDIRRLPFRGPTQSSIITGLV